MADNRIALAKYRLEKAKTCIEVSKLNFDNDYIYDSINRSYYAIFHSARAVMALDGEDRKKHSGVISYFQEHYIKTGVFARELSDIIQDAFSMRQITDYQDFFVLSRDEAKTQIKDAERFYEDIKSFVDNKINKIQGVDI